MKNGSDEKFRTVFTIFELLGSSVDKELSQCNIVENVGGTITFERRSQATGLMTLVRLPVTAFNEETANAARVHH